ncbi:hypothetical protein AB6D11_02930 [Vibrio splendidus]
MGKNVQMKDSVAAQVQSGNKARKEAKRLIQKRQRRLSDFVSTAKEVSPIFVIASANVRSKEELENNLVSYFGIQNKAKDYVIEKLEVTPDISSPETMHQLGESVSILLREGYLTHDNYHDKIDLLNEFLSSKQLSDSRVPNLIRTNRVSSDILVNIRAAIFPWCVRLQSVLERLTIDPKTMNNHMEWFHDTSVMLATDVAFNWDKEAMFKEREFLFVNMLGLCAEKTFSTWVTGYFNRFGNGTVVAEATNAKNHQHLIEKLPKSLNAINKNSMGYTNHPIKNMEWLSSSLSQALCSTLSCWDIRDLPQQQKVRYQAFIASKFDHYLSEVWTRMSKAMLDDIEKIPKNKRLEYLKKKSEEPPQISVILQEVNIHIEKSLELKMNEPLFENELLADAKQRIASLWGFSNTICKVRSTDHA